MIPPLIPKKVFFTSGAGRHTERLISFESALREAEISQYNLVKVSSIIPPGCEVVDKDVGRELLSPGEIVFCVLSHIMSKEYPRVIHASIGCAIPNDPIGYGYLSEYNNIDGDAEDAGSHARDMAVSMLDASRKLPADASTWHLTESSQTSDDGSWTCVCVAAIFVV